MKLRINNFWMHYEDQGQGIPLLLIHGFPLNHTLWEPQITGLKDVARVITPDLRGFGASEPANSTYTMEILATDCLNLLDTLGIHEPVFVGGLSMGGYITFSFYRLFPEKVKGLILAATRPGTDSPEGKANRDRLAQLAQERGPEAVAADMLPKMFSPTTYQNNLSLVDNTSQMMASTPVNGIIGALMGMKNRMDSTPLLPEMKKPVLILHGSDDQLIPLKEAEAMQTAIPGAKLGILPEAGHLLNLEQPDLSNRYIRDFLISV